MKRYTYNFFCTIFLYATLFTACKEKTSYSPERIKSDLITVSPNQPEDSMITREIAPYKNAIQKEMELVLAYAPASYSKKDGYLNTAIGNMMADAVFEMANPIFTKRSGYPFNAVLLNYGGIRSTINKGAITTKTAFELMPFENEVVVVELSGKRIKEMFNYLQAGVAHPISNIQIILNSDGKLEKTLIQGNEIIDNETYFIATNDYLLNGGDRMTFFSKPVSFLSLDYKVRNVLIDYFKKYDTIAPQRDDRFIKMSK